MEEIIQKLPLWLQVGAIVLSSVVVIATAVVRLTPSTEDDKKVARLKKIVDAILRWLPTLGVNPHTKKLEKKLEDKKT